MSTKTFTITEDNSVEVAEAINAIFNVYNDVTVNGHAAWGNLGKPALSAGNGTVILKVSSKSNKSRYSFNTKYFKVGSSIIIKGN